MMISSQYRAIVQLFAITLHTFLLGIVVLASVPQVADREGDYRPAHASRLAALHDQIDGTALNRGVKSYDSPSPAEFLALAPFSPGSSPTSGAAQFPYARPRHSQSLLANPTGKNLTVGGRGDVRAEKLLRCLNGRLP